MNRIGEGERGQRPRQQLSTASLAEYSDNANFKLRLLDSIADVYHTFNNAMDYGHFSALAEFSPKNIPFSIQTISFCLLLTSLGGLLHTVWKFQKMSNQYLGLIFFLLLNFCVTLDFWNKKIEVLFRPQHLKENRIFDDYEK